MAFTATIKSVTLQDDSIIVGVLFGDSVTGFTSNKSFTFNSDADTATMQSVITSTGTMLKANLAKNNILLSKVGVVLTI